MVSLAMWKCQVCDIDNEEDSWQECWKCSSRRDVDSSDLKSLRDCQSRKELLELSCMRCGTPSRYAGTKSFRGASTMGFWLGDLGHLFEGHETYDVYYCPHCGKVEFFVDGIGDCLRGEEP